MSNIDLAQIVIFKYTKDCEYVILKQNLKIARFKFTFYYNMVSVKNRMKKVAILLVFT